MSPWVSTGFDTGGIPSAHQWNQSIRKADKPDFVDVPSPEPEWKVLHRIADQAVPKVQAAFLTAIAQAKGGVLLKDVQEAIEKGNLLEASRLVESSWLAAKVDLEPELAEQLRNILEAAAKASIKTLPKGVTLRFDVTNPRAVQWIKDHAGKLITNISLETQTTIRNILVRAFTQGMHPREQAKLIKEIIGLTERQAQALLNFRIALETTAFPELSAEVLDQLRRIRGLGLAESGRVAELVDRYRERLLKDRAINIARTETIAASAQGQQQLWMEAVERRLINVKEWQVEFLVTPDDLLCPRCEDQERSFPHRPVDGVYANGETGPPIHPSCVPGDTLVSFLSAPVAASKRFYDGPLVVLRTSRGYQLSCTINHPILSRHGWVSATLLKEGDHIVCGDRADSLSGPDDQDENRISSIHDVFESFSASSQMFSVEVPITPPAFHGDGRYSNVAIIRADGELWNRFQSPTQQQIKESFFVKSQVARTLSGERRLDQFMGFPLATLCGSMGGIDLISPSFWSHLGPFDFFLFALCAFLNFRISENAVNNPSGYASPMGETVDRFSAGISLNKFREFVGSNIRPGLSAWKFVLTLLARHLGIVQTNRLSSGSNRDLVLAEKSMNVIMRTIESPGQFEDRSSSSILFDQIIGIEKVWFHGFVYNLHTLEGSFLANGIVTQNCRCAEALSEINP